MTVKELIQKLKEFPADADITITDGFECNCYHSKSLDFQLLKYSDFYNDKRYKHKQFVDIGIGGNKI